MPFLVLALVLAAAYVVARRHDRRMLRNGVFLLGAVGSAVLAVVDGAVGTVPAVSLVVLAALLLLPVVLVVLAGFLLANGVRMVRREGRSLGNALSAAAGAGILALLVVTVVVLRSQSTPVIAVGLLPLLVAGYVGAAFLVFLVDALVYRRVRVPAHPDAIVVLGSGLVRGEVPPLLRGRLDRAIAAYRTAAGPGPAPLVVPSGGQGPDEPRSEGEAMAEYLVAQGVPADHVRAETESRSTEENLVLSRRVLEREGRTGPVLVVTSDYHVLRAAMLARGLGTGAQVVGARTARYYVPSAFLREFVAVLVAHRVLHVVAVGVIVLGWLGLTLVSLDAA